MGTRRSGIIDSSAYEASRYPADLVDFLRGRRAKKVLFASNDPMITPGQCLEDLEGLGLAAEAEECFLRGNARKVFGLAQVARVARIAQVN
jgi:predicted TIM-barrel fold metal-dependent hydrolase